MVAARAAVAPRESAAVPRCPLPAPQRGTLGMFLGIDLGAGSLKATVIRRDGAVLAEASAPVETVRPRPGWAEQEPSGWLHALSAALKAISERIDLGGLNGISFTGGTHTCVLLDAHGEVVRRPILWSDQRAGTEAAALNERMQDRLIAIAYNKAAPTWSIAPLHWLVKNDPDAVRRTAKVLFVKDYLRHQLTGDWLTDRIDAQGTLMLDGGDFTWSDELCDAIGWDRATLPEIRNPTDRAGVVTENAARRFGLRGGTDVYVGTCDTAAEVWAAGAVDVGSAVIKLATAGVVSVMVDRPYLQTDIAYKSFVVPQSGYVLAAINSCASAHKWLRNVIGGRGTAAASFDELDREAGATAPGADGLLFHPYLQGERAPYWDPALRADFLGLTMSHDRGHLVRAFYEGVAFALRDAASRFRAAGLGIGSASLVGGGAVSDVWAQIIADVFAIEVRRPVHGDASYAAALMAAVGAGAFTDETDAVRRAVVFGPAIRPREDVAITYDRLFDRYQRSKQLLTALNHEISADA